MLPLFFFLQGNGTELRMRQPSTAEGEQLCPPHPTKERSSAPALEVCVFSFTSMFTRLGLEGSCQLIFIAMVTRVLWN